MEKSVQIAKQFKPYIKIIDEEIRDLLESQEKLFMFEMMEYFFGFKDEGLKEINSYGGKRFRSGLCLFLAEAFGNRDQLIEIAAAIEIFHNFTLIHDDIEDHDEIRRGRDTVWKKFGLEQAINTGDAQLVLTFQEINKAFAKHTNLPGDIYSFLVNTFLEVSKGQYLDIELANSSLGNDLVTSENYLKMITKKSALLISASSSVVGLSLGLPKEQTSALSAYGLNIGLAYQIWDDMISIWGDEEKSGKKKANDLYEKKKTLPIIFLYKKANLEEKTRLQEIYNNKKPLNESLVNYLYNLLDKYSVRTIINLEVKKYYDLATGMINRIFISDDNRNALLFINESLFCEGGKAR